MKCKPGINHIEFWVCDLKKSIDFYAKFFPIIGWKQLNEAVFCTENLEIYFIEKPLGKLDSLGVRHICFQAENRKVVDQVYALLSTQNILVIRGPIETEYSKDYYTIDFYDPDGNVFEVAHTPNMQLA